MSQRAAYRTPAQKELLAYLKATPGKHHTAAEIRDHFDQLAKPIGTATIYRQLERFVEEGSIRKYVLVPGKSACYSYEEGRNCAAHYHCKCEICGQVIHLDCEEILKIREHLRKEHGFFWNAGKTVFYGICEHCRRD